MRRIIGTSLLIFASLIFIISAVSGFTGFFFKVRRSPLASKSWWGADRFDCGDLYGMTFLPQFRIKAVTSEDYKAEITDCRNTTKRYNIYAYTDSYTVEILKNPNNFCGANEVRYAFINYGEELPVFLDKTKKNIILIECVERDVRGRLSDTSYLQRFIAISKQKLKDSKEAETGPRFHFDFKLKNADGNYETNLWDYQFLRPLKELKAKMNFGLFNRISGEAVVSPDGKYLLYGCTVDTAFSQCSYRPISDKEIKELITGLNKTYDHYKGLGFDEIYLSIIPNPATILYPDYKGFHYNQLIPKLENDPSLKLKVIDTYQLFKNCPQKDRIYQRSDTHWTIFGSQLWLNEFNKKMPLSYNN